MFVFPTIQKKKKEKIDSQNDSILTIMDQPMINI